MSRPGPLVKLFSISRREKGQILAGRTPAIAGPGLDCLECSKGSGVFSTDRWSEGPQVGAANQPPSGTSDGRSVEKTPDPPVQRVPLDRVATGGADQAADGVGRQRLRRPRPGHVIDALFLD